VINLPDVSREMIEQHEDMALISALVVGALGLLSVWALWRYRRPAIVSPMIVRSLLVGAVIGAALMAYTGLLGGQIRHSEVRPGFVPPPRGTAGPAG
jgi:uncharacterized membrane protein